MDPPMAGTEEGAWSGSHSSRDLPHWHLTTIGFCREQSYAETVPLLVVGGLMTEPASERPGCG